MKHYTNQHSSSREFYNNLQGKNHENLNLSSKKLDKTEIYLERLLLITYKYLSPIFEDDEVMNSFKNDTKNNYIDKKVDEQISRHTPSWIQGIVAFFIQIYEKFFPKRSKTEITNRIKHLTNFTNKNKISNQKMKNIFTLNKSSP